MKENKLILGWHPWLYSGTLIRQVAERTYI